MSYLPVLIVVGALALVAGVLFLVIRLGRKVGAEVRRRYQDRGIELLDNGANFFGVESRGHGQVRGNGCLVLTADEVAFVMWLPRRELVIPRERILGTETPRSHLGKTKGVKLLKIRFRDEVGNEDSVAWAIRDLQAWLQALG